MFLFLANSLFRYPDIKVSILSPITLPVTVGKKYSSINFKFMTLRMHKFQIESGRL